MNFKHFKIVVMTTKQLAKQAQDAAKQYKLTRKIIIADARKLLNANDKIFKRVNKIDPAFMRKLNYYPSDLVLQRIADVLTQL